MHKARPFLLAIAAFTALTAMALASTTAQVHKQHTEVYARYFFSGETAYRAIELDGLKIKITYFKDADKKCKNWIEQRPCWTEKDLVTKEAPVTKRELADFVSLINRSKFLLLEKTYGGAAAGQRFYAQTIKVKLGEIQQEVVYQSFPEAAPRPQAFTKVADWLSKIVTRKFAL